MSTVSTIEKKTLSVGKYVGNDHVNSIISTYKQERWAQNSEKIGKEDSLSVWYSTEELEEFIDTIKANGGNGIRFYFAAYPDNYTDVPEYAGRQTLALVATKTRKVEGKLSHKEIYMSENGNPKILAYNSGSMCPPFCGYPVPPTTAVLGLTLVDKGDKGFSIV